MKRSGVLSLISLETLCAYLSACGGAGDADDSADVASQGGHAAISSWATSGGQAIATSSQLGAGGGRAAGSSGAGADNRRNTAGARSAGATSAVGGADLAGSGSSTGATSAGVRDTSGAGNASRSGGSAGVRNSADSGDDGFVKCVGSLKAKCPYNQPENACSSIMTAVIPLSDGTTWGNIELTQGPYGSYVEWNEGQGFANPESMMEATCAIAAASFGEPESVTEDVLDLRDQDLKLYTVYRPACMKEKERYPVITWGNGTCGQSGSYGAFLATVASYGFVVIAANSRWTDQGNKEMLNALDFAKAANEDPTHALFQRLDLSKVGAMGHSQGGSATVHAATDPRIKAVILWNGGTSASKPFLAVSGDRDIGGRTVASLASAVNGASQPGAWLYYHQVLETGGGMTGHLTLMEQPERVTAPTIAWWKYTLNGDVEAKKMFVGTDCGLCNHQAEYEFGQHGLP